MQRSYFEWQRWRWLTLGGALALLAYMIYRYGGSWFSELSGDFLQYWAAARLNLAGENPFVHDRVYALWQSAGWRQSSDALVMYNPPWMLTLMLPWAILDAETACLLWRLCLLLYIFASVDVLWHQYGGPAALRPVSWCVGLLFIPVIMATWMGQMGPVVLLGAALFLWGEAESVDSRPEFREWAAAGALMLISSKPHVLYLFWVAFLIWVITFSRWSLLGKVAILSAAALLIPMLTNPAVLSQYVAAIWQRPPDRWISSAWGSFLRLAFGHNKFWLQFIPSLLAGSAYTVYVWCKRKEWDWTSELPALILWAQITRPYGWTHDLVVTLLPLIAATARAAQHGLRDLCIAFFGYVLLQAIILLAIRFTPPGDHHLVWLPLVVGGYYLFINPLALKVQSRGAQQRNPKR